MKTVALLGNSDLVIYNFRKELVERLRKEGIQVLILIPKVVHQSFFDEMGCKVYETPIERRGTNPITDLKLLHQYETIFKKEKPDLIYTFTIKCSVYGGFAAARYHIPQITNVTGLGSSILNGGLLEKISEGMYRLGTKKSVCTFYQNEFNESICLKKGIVGKKYRRVPGSGVNLSEFACLPYPLEEKVHFFFISRVMKEKGIEEFLTMAKTIHQEYPMTHFHILGFCEEDYLKNLQELENEGIVEYHGMQQDVYAFQGQNCCLIHPSYHEGMSNVCLESAACGRPIIASDIPGCREIVEDGVTGYLVKSCDSQALTDAVRKFMGLSVKDREKMGLLAREKMEKEFDRNLVVDAYLEESKPYLS